MPILSFSMFQLLLLIIQFFNSEWFFFLEEDPNTLRIEVEEAPDILPTKKGLPRETFWEELWRQSNATTDPKGTRRSTRKDAENQPPPPKWQRYVQSLQQQDMEDTEIDLNTSLMGQDLKNTRIHAGTSTWRAIQSFRYSPKTCFSLWQCTTCAE
jgi:hypothetical protein